MKTIVTLSALLISTTLVAQTPLFEKAPVIPENTTASTTRDTFNLQFQFPTAAFVGEYGIESDGQFIYITQWLGDSIAKYDMSGNVLDTFEIPGVSQVRDLAWDGTYFYGSPNDYKFYVLDLNNKLLINTFTTDMKIRGMAYDPDTDALWVSEHWSPSFFRIDKNSGATLDTLQPAGITLDAISGLAYDNQSPNGPFLWGFSQDSTGAIIIKYDIPNKTQTGNMIDVSTLATGAPYAGGLFIEPITGMPGVTIGGMIQNDQVFALELGYANTLVSIDEKTKMELKIYPNPAQDQLFLEINDSGDYKVSVYNQLGQVVMEDDIRISGNSQASVSVSSLEEGIYIVEILDVNGMGTRLSFIRAR